MLNKPDQFGKQPDLTSVRRQEDAARAVVEYCQNISECRRVQILQYFGEKFDRKKCARGCDNCAHDQALTYQDVTTASREAVRLVQALQEQRERVTVAQCRDMLRGTKKAELRKRRAGLLPMLGVAREMPLELVEQMLQRLLFMDVLVEVSQQNASGYHTQYLGVSGTWIV